MKNSLKNKQNNLFIMIFNEYADTYNEALNSWGFDAQMDVTVEELSELIKAFMKHRRRPCAEKAIDIAEEMADVMIMIDQMRIAMYQKYPEFDHWLSENATRKMRRVNAMLEEYHNNQPDSEN